jgi:hypothetical protein
VSFVAECEQCGVIERGEFEAVGDAAEDHEQFHGVKISRVVTDGGTQTAGHLDSDDETDLDVDDPEDAGAILDDLEAPGKEVAESAD